MYTHFPSLASNKPNVHAMHADKKVFICNYFFTTRKKIYKAGMGMRDRFRTSE
jgi:hypothetical protein